MRTDTCTFATDARRQLEADGYCVHEGTKEDGPDLAGRYWFSWSKPDMADAEVGRSSATEWAAWSDALAHRLANSEIAIDSSTERSARRAEPFFSARLPDSALDVDTVAQRFGVTRDVAAREVEKLKRQSVYLSDQFQVNVQLISSPFGAETGDIFWLSIKRRDRAAIHDWRELQQVKNIIVGAEHEAFEVYPAESRLVDTANQFHLWVFADPTVRLPVGFVEREVLDHAAAAAVGSRQRPFSTYPLTRVEGSGRDGDR